MKCLKKEINALNAEVKRVKKTHINEVTWLSKENTTLRALLTEAREFLQAEYDESLDYEGMIALGEFLPTIDAALGDKK